jgi:hypothetical protein
VLRGYVRTGSATCGPSSTASSCSTWWRRSCSERAPRGRLDRSPCNAERPIFIVTSSRPRVGKTLIARALTEYFCAQSRPVAAFDVNPDEFKLIDHLPAYTAARSITTPAARWRCSISSSADDGAEGRSILGHQLLDRFFSVMQQIDFMAEVRRRAVAPMVLFVADPDERSRQGYAMRQRSVSGPAAGAGAQ